MWCGRSVLSLVLVLSSSIAWTQEEEFTIPKQLIPAGREFATELSQWDYFRKFDANNKEIDELGTKTTLMLSQQVAEGDDSSAIENTVESIAYGLVFPDEGSDLNEGVLRGEVNFNGTLWMYDSQKPSTDQAVNLLIKPVFESWPKQKFVLSDLFTVGKQPAVTGMKKILESRKQPAENAAVYEMAGAAFTDEEMAQILGLFRTVLIPSDPVKIGSRWEKTLEHKTIDQDAISKYEFTVLAVKEHLMVITYKGTTEPKKAAGNDPKAGMYLRSLTFDGQAVFNLQLGAVIDQRERTRGDLLVVEEDGSKGSAKTFSDVMIKTTPFVDAPKEE